VAEAWAADANADVECIDAFGTRLFVGGGFSFVGSAGVSGVAEIWPDPAVGVPTPPGGAEAKRLVLAPPFPNPARGRTVFRFRLPAAGAVRLGVFDARGRRVAEVAPPGTLAAGDHALTAPLGGLAAGVYFARLEGPGGPATRRVVVLP